jgi:hypothetical protein
LSFPGRVEETATSPTTAWRLCDGGRNRADGENAKSEQPETLSSGTTIRCHYFILLGSSSTTAEA